MMKPAKTVFTTALYFLLLAAVATAGEKPGSFSPYVDYSGAISMPTGFRSTWVHLGTWVLTSPMPPGSGLERTSPGTGIHTAYTQPSSFSAFKKKGAWPDGTVLILEVRAIAWDDMPTGHVIVEGDVVKWLVMIKDGKGRFPKNPNWGDGWGWALFKPAALKNNASTNYKNDCLNCHEPVKDSDLVFIQGYPALRQRQEWMGR